MKFYSVVRTSGPVFCLLLRVSSDYAQPITGQVTKITCPVIGRAPPELTLSKRQKTGPGLYLQKTAASGASFLLRALFSLCPECWLEAGKKLEGPANFTVAPASFPSFSCLNVVKDKIQAGKFSNRNAFTVCCSRFNFKQVFSHVLLIGIFKFYYNNVVR